MSDKISLSATIFDCEPTRSIRLKGRDAWALSKLVVPGSQECTPHDTPGPCWSGYVFNLRQMGLDIETIHERHAGPFAGKHAQYVLRLKVHLVPLEDSIA